MSNSWSYSCQLIGVVRMPESLLPVLLPTIVKFADKRQTSMGDGAKKFFALARVFSCPDNGVSANFQTSGGIANPGTIEGDFSVLLFNT